MELKISNKVENQLLNRTEITGEVLHAGAATPKRIDVKKLLAAQLGADESLLTIRKVNTPFGAKSKLTAMLYKDKATLEKFEPKYVIGRDTGNKKKRVGKKK